MARHATLDDIDELVRLRGVLFAGVAGDAEWQAPARHDLKRRLSDPAPTLAGFVVDRPDGSGLAACVLGVIEERLGGPHEASGRSGYVFNVATDPDQRRRGYSRQCMEALLAWFRSEGIRSVHLRASAAGEPLYASLGFVRTPDPAMRLRLPG